MTTTDTAPAPLLLTFGEVCRELRLGGRTARRLLSAGRLPAPDLNVTGGLKGRRWRADRLAKWIDCGAPNADAWAAHVMKGNKA